MTTQSVGAEESGATPRRRRGTASRIVIAGVRWVAALFALAVGALLWWTNRPYHADLAAHFGVFLVLGAAVCSAASLVGRRGPLAYIACAGVLAGVGGAARDYWPALFGFGGEGAVRLIHYNAHGRPLSPAFIAWVDAMEADVVCIAEAPAALFVGSAAPFEGLDHALPAGPSWRSPESVYSRRPIETVESSMEEGGTLRLARLDLGDDRAALLSVHHPQSPRTRVTWRVSLRHSERSARALREARAELGLPMIVSADMNSTPHGRLHRAFARSSGLRRWGPGLFAGSWPAAFPAWAALPIDRVWVSESLRIASARVGPAFDSDHRPVVVEIGFADE